MNREDLLKNVPSNFDSFSLLKLERYINSLFGECNFYIDKSLMENSIFNPSDFITRVIKPLYIFKIKEKSEQYRNFNSTLFKKAKFINYSNTDQLINVKTIDLYEKDIKLSIKATTGKRDKNIILASNRSNEDLLYAYNMFEKNLDDNIIFLVFDKKSPDLSDLYEKGIENLLPFTFKEEKAQEAIIVDYLGNNKLSDNEINKLTHQKIKKLSNEEMSKLDLTDKFSNDVYNIAKLTNELLTEAEKSMLIVKDLVRKKQDKIVSVNYLRNEITKASNRGEISANGFTHGEYVRLFFEKNKKELEKGFRGELNSLITECENILKKYNFNKKEVFKRIDFRSFNYVQRKEFSNGHIVADGLAAISSPFNALGKMYKASAGIWKAELADKMYSVAKYDFIAYYKNQMRDIWQKQFSEIIDILTKSLIEDKKKELLKEAEGLTTQAEVKTIIENVLKE